MQFSRARLRGHRDGLALSQEEVAQRACLLHTVYNGIENGSIQPSLAHVESLARALDIPISELEGAGTWEREYVDSVLRYAAPLSTEDVDRAAEALISRSSS